MVEDQGFNSLKCYNQKEKEIIFHDVDLAGVDHKKEDGQYQIEKTEVREDEEYEYESDNAKDIYDEDIDK